MANGLETPFAAQPAALAEPVPGQDVEQLSLEFQKFKETAQFEFPKELEDEFERQQPVDQLLKDFQEFKQQAAETEKLRTEIQPGSALGLFERAKLSFAQTEVEQRSFLEGIPGVTKVEFKDGDPIVTRNGKRKRVDPEEFEFFADLFADIARPVLEAGIEVPFITAGATIGGALGATAGTAAAPVAGTIAGGAAGLIAGGAAGAAIATNLGDFVQESLIGIERDPERSRLLETALSAVLGGTLNLVGGKLVALGAKRKLVKEIAGQNVAAVGKIDRLGTEFRGALTDLQDAGLTTTVTGADGKPINVLLSNLDLNTPEAKQLVTTLRSSDDFLRIQDDLAEIHRENVDVILESIGDTQGIRNFDKIAATDSDIAEKVVGFVKNLKEAEGKKIGEFKTRAAKLFRTSPAPVSRTDGALIEVFEEFGVRRKGDELLGLDADSISKAVAIENPNLLKPIVSVVEDLNETLLNKGGLSPADLEKFVKRVGNLNASRAISKEGVLKRQVAKLSSALRSDRIDTVEEALPDNLKGEFRASMQKFSRIARSTGEVAELLDGDELATDAFVNSIFKGGKDSLRRLRATKAIVRQENPQLWKELSGEFLNKIILDASKGGTVRPTIQQVISKLNKFGPSFRKELLEDSPFSVKDLQSALALAQKFEKTNLEAASQETAVALAASFRKIFSPFVDARLNSARNIFNTVFGTPQIRKLLTQQGMDDFLAAGTLKKRKFAKRLNDIFISTTGVAPVTATQLGVEAAVREEGIR